MIRGLRIALLAIGGTLAVLYAVFLAWLYFNQESMIFVPSKLSAGYHYTFGQPFREVTISASDGIKLNGVLFTADKPKGLIFYLHGNAGALDSWGAISSHYTGLGYDIFMLDYRGYGKSEGHIESEKQFLADVSAAYDQVARHYRNTVIIGYSIGTGPAAYLASVKNPTALILQAPYFSLDELADSRAPLVPDFVKKYHFRTDKFLMNTNCPMYIFHGDNDHVIAYDHAVLLKKLLGARVTLITLAGQDHVGLNENPEFLSRLKTILAISASHDTVY